MTSYPRPQLVSSLHVTVAGRPTKVKEVLNIPAFSAGVDYRIFNKSLPNALKSVSERFLYIKTSDGGFGLVPQPKPYFERKLARFKQLIMDSASFIPPLTKTQFLGAYVGRKKTIYENAFKSLEEKPFKDSDSYVSWFAKMEKIQFKETKETVPRGYNVESVSEKSGMTLTSPQFCR